ENGGLAGAGRSDNQAARAFADGRDHINDAGLDQIRTGFETEFFNRINRGQVLKADSFGVVVEGHVVDLFDGFELGTVTSVRRLSRAGDETAFTQETALDRVGGDEDVSRLGVKMVLGRAEETKALFGDFQITGTEIRVCRARIVMVVFS